MRHPRSCQDGTCRCQYRRSRLPEPFHHRFAYSFGAARYQGAPPLKLDRLTDFQGCDEIALEHENVHQVGHATREISLDVYQQFDSAALL